MGLFNFGSKKKEDKKKQATDSTASPQKQSSPAAPAPPQAPKAPGAATMPSQQKPNDELEIPPLPDSFSGSMDLHPEKQMPPKQEKDPSLLEINSDELDTDTSQKPDISDKNQTPTDINKQTDSGIEMPPPPEEFPSANQQDSAGPKMPQQPKQDSGNTDMQQKSPEPEHPPEAQSEGVARPSRQQVSDFYNQKTGSGQPMDNLMDDLEDKKESQDEILPPPPLGQDDSFSSDQAAQNMPSEEPNPPVDSPGSEVEEPTKPLELDTPPVPDKLNLDDIDSLYDDMKKTAQPEDGSQNSGKAASTIDTLPERPTKSDSSAAPGKGDRREINQGIQKLDLREEKEKTKTVPQPSLDLTSTDFKASTGDEKKLDDNLFSSQGEMQIKAHEDEQKPNIPEHEEVQSIKQENESTGMDINKKIVMSADGTRPLFLDLMSFKNIVDVLDSFNNETKLAEDTLFRLNDLNDQETKQYKKWQKSLEELERSIISIDKSLFKV